MLVRILEFETNKWKTTPIFFYNKEGTGFLTLKYYAFLLSSLSQPFNSKVLIGLTYNLHLTALG